MKKYSDDVIEQIVEKVDILEFISQYVELNQHGKDYFGECIFHSEKTPSFSVSPSKKIFFCFGCGRGGNIIQFIQEYKKLSFSKAVEYLINYVGGINIVEEKSETIKFLKEMNKLFKNHRNNIEREILSDNIMDKYRKADIQEWIQEEISQEVMDKYLVRYDDRSNRIVFPIWDNEGNIINIKGRTLYPNYRELGIKKYLYYYPLNRLDFLYSLHNKREIIQKSNEVIIVEGVKSIYKLETWNINNAISLETNRINEYQIDILLNLKCPIVMCLDKGVELEAIKKDTLPLKKFTDVSVIYDTNNLLEEKDSPVDRGLFTFLQLYEERIKI
jgi:DNA primase